MKTVMICIGCTGVIGAALGFAGPPTIWTQIGQLLWAAAYTITILLAEGS